jgi:hypothetical protein
MNAESNPYYKWVVVVPLGGLVDRLHALRFLRACDPGYRGLALTLVGLFPTETRQPSSGHAIGYPDSLGSAPTT